MLRFSLQGRHLALTNPVTAEILAKRKFLVDPIQNILISKVNCGYLRLFPETLNGIISGNEINNKIRKNNVLNMSSAAKHTAHQPKEAFITAADK